MAGCALLNCTFLEQYERFLQLHQLAKEEDELNA